MITKPQLDLLWNIEVACHRCMWAARCYNSASGSTNHLWVFTQNCYGSIAVIHWCQVLGAESEPTHYSRLFEQDIVGVPSRDDVKRRLRGAVMMDESQYGAFWHGVMKARDRYLVHNEFAEVDRPVFPDLDQMMKVCMEMRDILRELLMGVERGSLDASDAPTYENIWNYITFYSNSKWLEEIDRRIPALSAAMNR